MLLPPAVEMLHDLALPVERHHQDHADPHVEGPEHLVVVDPPLRLEVVEDRRHRPGPDVDARRDAAGQDAGNVVGEAAAGDVRQAVDGAGRDQPAQRRQVGAVHLQELLPHRPVQLR